jgi:hypothetical protein
MTSGMFSFDQLQFRYEPFPIGMARPLMDAGLYREFVDEFPDADMFGDLSVVGSKYSLSEKTNRRSYHELVHTRPVWKELHKWIKSDAFIKDVLQALEERHLELGYRVLSPGRRIVRRISKLAKGHFRSTRGRLGARFEYSMLPVDGGHVLPHTDSPGKIVTIIVSILDENEWDPAFGGGTDLNRPRSPEHSFNRLNRQGRFEDMEVIDTFDFQPNQAVMFVRTFNSWHSVRPMQGRGSSAMRRSLTINIEERH